MPHEIERKFLVNLNKVTLPSGGVSIRQGYLPVSENEKAVVRVRVKGSEATLAVKGENIGAVRPEFEYSIPVNDANTMLDTLCQKPKIDKTRYEIPAGKHIWEIDVFHGDNQGLIVAEIELADESDSFEKPEWLSDEVTDDPKYYNSNLLQNPFNDWSAT